MLMRSTLWGIKDLIAGQKRSKKGDNWISLPSRNIKEMSVRTVRNLFSWVRFGKKSTHRYMRTWHALNRRSRSCTNIIYPSHWCRVYCWHCIRLEFPTKCLTKVPMFWFPSSLFSAWSVFLPWQKLIFFIGLLYIFFRASASQLCITVKALK